MHLMRGAEKQYPEKIQADSLEQQDQYNIPAQLPGFTLSFLTHSERLLVRMPTTLPVRTWTGL